MWANRTWLRADTRSHVSYRTPTSEPGLLQSSHDSIVGRKHARLRPRKVELCLQWQECKDGNFTAVSVQDAEYNAS
jgi:hypothetical protein